LSIVPSLNTVTTRAAIADSPTTCTDRTEASAGPGATTTLVRLVRLDSSRLVSDSICSTSPWARSKKARTSSAERPGRRGWRRWSTKKR
jgi:hypothetical protein